jgi:regulatory protein
MKEINLRQALLKLQKTCSMQEKCIADIMQKLKAWEISDEDSKRILESLKKDKFIDEERYAIFFVRDKYKINKWGREKIKYALIQKGIPDEIIETALSEIKFDEYEHDLKELLARKKKLIKSGNSYETRGKLIRFGAQKGYSFDIVYKLVDELMKE